VVALFTFGTGIGSAFFVDGVLFPNTEFGHMMIRGHDAEKLASAKIKTDEQLSWEAWAERVNEFLAEIDRLFTPDLIILGGGVSQDFALFGHYLKSQAPIVPARLQNDAGIIGAAMAAQKLRS
jgi:polyphosphate glucokinase